MEIISDGLLLFLLLFEVDVFSLFLIHAAEKTANEYTVDFAQRRNLSLDLSFGGFDFVVGPKEFGIVAGKFAGGVVSTLLDGSVKDIAERGTSVSNIVSPGQTGRYGTLAKNSHKDGLQVDHIPSHGSNVLAEEARLRRKLTGPEERRLKKEGGAMVVPDEQHRGNSRTMGGRNNMEIRTADAANPAAAVVLDVERYTTYLKSLGKTDSEIQAAIKHLIDMRKK
jgi:hypothetical protein